MKKTANPNCPNCKGRGYNLYEDSWDSDNYSPCLLCFSEPVVKVEIEVFKKKGGEQVSSQITCGKERNFEEVLEGLKSCVKELQWQIKNRKKCPANKKKI